MTALAQALSLITGVEIDAGTLETIVIFCGIGLAYSLFAIAAYGLDLTTTF